MKSALTILYTLIFFSSCHLLKKDDDQPSVSEDAGTSSSQQGTGDETESVTAPNNFEINENFDPTNDAFTLTWSNVDGATSYEIAVGTSAGTTDVLDWHDVGNISSVSTQNLNLPDAGMFYASVRAVASDGSKSEPATGEGWQHLVCPLNWIRVPGNTTPGIGGNVYVNGTRTRHNGSSRTLSDFCVMKYEMKLYDSVGTVSGSVGIVADGNFSNFIDYSNGTGDVTGLEARSTAEGRPWVWIKRKDTNTGNDLLDAERACSNLSGTGLVSVSVDNNFHLINNSQWQAIARNIENDVRNTNAGAFNRGHSDNGPAESLAAVDDDTLGCFGMSTNGLAEPSNTDDDCEGAVHINKRTHILSNDEVVWDISGNVWEWVIDNVDTGPVSIIPNPDVSNKWDIEYTDPTCGGGTDPCFSLANRLTFAPETLSFTSTERVGKFFGGAGTYLGAAVRSGDWAGGTFSGVFSALLGLGPSSANGTIGARCVWAP